MLITADGLHKLGFIPSFTKTPNEYFWVDDSCNIIYLFASTKNNFFYNSFYVENYGWNCIVFKKLLNGKYSISEMFIIYTFEELNDFIKNYNSNLQIYFNPQNILYDRPLVKETLYYLGFNEYYKKFIFCDKLLKKRNYVNYIYNDQNGNSILIKFYNNYQIKIRIINRNIGCVYENMIATQNDFINVINLYNDPIRLHINTRNKNIIYNDYDDYEEDYEDYG